MKSFSPIVSATALVQFAAAARWAEPSATATGEWEGGMGFSPIPTEAPGSALGGIEIPKELRRRQGFPDNWCGYVNGDVNDVLSCGAAYTCVHLNTAVGCCGAGPISTCTALYTTCVNSADGCGSACGSNQKILKCTGIALPFCATYTFASSLVNYNCASQKGVLSSVAFLSDVLGSGSASPTLTLPTSRFSTSLSISTTISSASASASATTSSDINLPTPSNGRKKSVPVGAIAGGVVGGIAVIGLLLGLLVYFLCLKGKKKTPAPAAAPIPPMDQQQPPQQPPYQSPPVAGVYPPQAQYGQPQQGPYYGAQPNGAANSYYDAKATDVPPQYQPNTQSSQPPQQEYVPFNAAAGGPRDSMAKPVPEISGTEVSSGPSRVTSPVSAMGTGNTAGQQGYEVGSTSGPVFEMAGGAHR
ncbi:MAG: hypothetical protein M1839_005189 [Geoglossum umbratile]|nr:MAG: hypothetical protein M1839_005189 [Geoglossum umbratile]